MRPYRCAPPPAQTPVLLPFSSDVDTAGGWCWRLVLAVVLLLVLVLLPRCRCWCCSRGAGAGAAAAAAPAWEHVAVLVGGTSVLTVPSTSAQVLSFTSLGSWGEWWAPAASPSSLGLSPTDLSLSHVHMCKILLSGISLTCAVTLTRCNTGPSRVPLSSTDRHKGNSQACGPVFYRLYRTDSIIDSITDWTAFPLYACLLKVEACSLDPCRAAPQFQLQGEGRPRDQRAPAASGILAGDELIGAITIDGSP